MARSALARMGASADRIEAFERQYVPSRGLRHLAVGDPEAISRAVMRSRIARTGREAVLYDELGILARGIGAGAFHAFIRVAYAIADGNDDELAAGLTYWRSAALDLGAQGPPARTAESFDPAGALALARALLAHVPPSLDAGALIAERMAAVARDGAFDAVVGEPYFEADAVSRIAAATVRIFAATRSFTLLHAMTATHAIRIVLPFAPDRNLFLAYFWRAYVAAYVSAGAPAFLEATAFASAIASAPNWEPLLAIARGSDDEHVVKATFTAWTEDSVYHDPLYRVATVRYLRLDDAARATM